MRMIWNDMRFGVRQLRKNPGFSVVVILILALGIGINATAFTFINAILFRPLPVREPDQLFSVSIHTQDEVFDGRFSYPDLEFLRSNADVFEGVFTFKPWPQSWQWQPNQTRKIQTEWVSRDYFKTLGVHTCLGRSFSDQELSVPNAYPVVVLSHAFWSSQLEGNPDVLGTDMMIGGKNYTVVGVAEAGFEGMRPSKSPDLWLPLMMHGQVSGSALTDAAQYEVVGRVRADSTARTAETQLTALLPELEKNFPKFKGKRAAGKVKLTACGYGSLARNERGAAWIGSMIFLAVTGMVLLIACANMANLLLARALARRKEIATRLALGAGRMDLVRQLLCESLVLALAGGLIGLWLTHGATQVFTSVRPGGVKLPRAIGLDTRVVVFTVLLSLLTTLIFGLMPALQGTRVAIYQVLKENPGMVSGRTRRFGLRNLLIALIPETKGRECPIWDLVEDFILLPYRPEELGLRIRQAQRRRGLRLSGEVARIGDLVIDFSSYEVSLRGISLTLTYREYELLRFLVTHPNRVFSRDALLKKVWGYEAYVGTRTVDIHIRRLRSKLGDSGSGIQTVRNVGYKFARES